MKPEDTHYFSAETDEQFSTFFHPPLTYTDSPSGLLHSSTCCSHPHSDSVDGVVSHSYGGLGGASSD